MSAQPAVAAPSPSEKNWGLWLHQVRAILAIELRRNFFSGRSLLVYILAAAPIFVALMVVLTTMLDSDVREGMVDEAQILYALIFQFTLRGSIYLGCVWIFMNLYRGDVLDRSLHYYFLAPVRRSVLTVGKYLSGVISSIVIFGATSLAVVTLLYLAVGRSTSSSHFQGGTAISHSFSYLVITALACIGYGAVFMTIGLFMKNPVIPAFAVWVWESANAVLPASLQKISIIHYLQSLRPIETSPGTFAVLSEATPLYYSIPGILIVSAILVGLASWRASNMEIDYAAD